MATVEQQKSFINQIAPLAQLAYKTLGKVKPSVCIAMACCESGYGTAGSCKHNSYIGQKVGTGKTATKYWSGKFFTSKTGEEYTLGVHTTINAAFRSYDSMQQCVFNYYELLNTSIYGKVLSDSDYKSQMQQIKAVGYMTSSTEVNTVLSIIAKYNLTQYDTVQTSAEPIPVSNPYREPICDVKKGDKGVIVKWVQWYLWKFGLLVNSKGVLSDANIDGIFGDQTDAQVREAQHRLGLVVDGVVGKNTKAAFKKTI